MEKKKVVVLTTIVVAVLLVCVVGATFAYYAASVGGTGNTQNNQTSVTAVDLGSIKYDGVTTFTGTNLYPGQKFVQEFKIGPNSTSGTGIYEIDLEAVVPSEFGSDVTIKLYKTTDKTNNNVVRTEGSLVQSNGQYYQEDTITVNGTPELVYSSTLSNSSQIILEQADFDVTTMQETTYYLVYDYANNGNQDAQQGKTFNGKVTVRLVLEKLPDVAESIIAQVDTTGKCPTVNANGTVKITSEESTNALVCSAPDDYGTSYYYRGVPENNWVKFGGYYWRILRVNGDNSIRMIYAGDASVIDALDETTKASVLKNGYDDSSTKYTQIGESRYNYYWKKDNVQETTNAYLYYDNAGVGYMYGNRDGVTEGTTEYSTSSWTSTVTIYVSEEYSYDATTDTFSLKNPIAVLASEMTSEYIGYYTHNNTSSSSSYNYIRKITSVSVGESSTKVGYSYVRYGTASKAQAQTNTNDSTIKAYLDNWYTTNLASYENYISDTLFCNDRTIQETIPSGYSNLGYGVEKTDYRTYNPSNGIKLTCQEQNDRFTVDDEAIGNGDLTYPIGLLTTDEVYLAGGHSSSNRAYYLYTENDYWTMSPSYFDGSSAGVKDFNSNGGAGYSLDVSNSSVGVRPVINLKSGSLTKGSGSASDPWRVE